MKSLVCHTRIPLFILNILKSLVIPAIWLALSSVVYLQITLFFALNHICSKSRHSCSKSHHFCFNSHHFCSAHCFCFEYKMRCKRFCFRFLRNRLLDQWNISSNWILWFQMAVIKWKSNFVSSNFGLKSLKSRVWFQTNLHSTQFNYHH